MRTLVTFAHTRDTSSNEFVETRAEDDRDGHPYLPASLFALCSRLASGFIDLCGYDTYGYESTFDLESIVWMRGRSVADGTVAVSAG